MKRALFFVVPFALAMVLSSARADDAKPGEWVVTVGCQHCNFEADTGAGHCGAAAKTADGKVVMLKGETKGLQFKAGGQYTVKGTLSADGKSIEVKEFKKNG